MKASDLLKLIENSKGGKKAEGELKRPTYRNDKTPDNHVKGKKNRVVGNKIDKGEKHDGKKAPQITPPSKKERRSMEGPGRKVKTMEATAESLRGNILRVDPTKKTFTIRDNQRNQEITVPVADSRRFTMIRSALEGNDDNMATQAYAALINSPDAQFERSSFPDKEAGAFEKGAGAGGGAEHQRAGRTGRENTGRNVYGGDVAGAEARANKLSLADSKGKKMRENMGSPSGYAEEAREAQNQGQWKAAAELWGKAVSASTGHTRRARYEEAKQKALTKVGVSESGGEHSDSMGKQTVDNQSGVSKSATVRTKQNDAKNPTAKVGSPKNKEKRSMDANPVTVKDCKGGENEHKSMKMHEGVAELENWLGTSLNLDES